tara:strand:- start:516 stop:716 length:201 start_codon:yes stop_codon:yes gene_type:complete
MEVAMMEQSYLEILGSNVDVINRFWNEYFKGCTMSTPTTGLEMPHEENITYSHNSDDDEYHFGYGW